MRVSGWDRPKPSLKLGKCVSVGWKKKETLNIDTRPVLQVTEVPTSASSANVGPNRGYYDSGACGSNPILALWT